MWDALVFGVDSDTVRKKCIAEGNELTFGKAREIARTEEATGRQLEMMTRDVPNPMQVDSLQKNRKRKIIQGRIKPLYDRQKGQNVRKEKTVCNRCGKAAHNKDKKCPAIKAQCFGCKKIGHYQKVCFKTTKTNCNSLEHESGNSNKVDIDDKIFLGTLVAEQCLKIGAKPNLNSLSTEQRKKVLIETHLTAEPYHKYTTPVVCKIDTGAELNVLSNHDYEKVVPNPKRRKLESPNIKITAYGGHEIRNIGTCQLHIHHKVEAQPIVFNVTDVEGPAILGCKTSCDLGLVQFPSKVFHVHASAPNSSSSQNAGKRVTPLTKESLLKEYPDRFEGLGTFKAMKPYHITLEPNAEPVIHPPRQVPVHLKDHYKQEIDNLLELGVITPVERPTDWVNSVVLSETTSDKGEIVKVRLCLDPRDLNKWVKREHYRTRAIDEVVVELKDAKFFTVVDAKKGYWHVPLDEESSYLTTFSTPYGRYRFLRLPFGLVVSQDIFQKQLDTALEGLNGITGIADDTFVYGSSEEEHDANLVKLMERARDKGVIFNKEKLQFKCKEVSFFGHTWTLQGMKPDDKKVSAILGMKPPEDAKSLKSFHGLVSYLTRYSGRLATLSSPLRDLIKQDVSYSWGPEHARAFDEVKKEVSSLGVLRYFEPSAETTVQTDASLKGLGAVLLQGGQPPFAMHLRPSQKSNNDTVILNVKHLV